MSDGRTGPLAGVRVLEIAALGPVSFACMMLADMGAEVLRLERPTGRSLRLVEDSFDVPARGRRSAAIDLKAPGAAELVRRLGTIADVLIEGFRPGVCERLGIGPTELLADNPALIYARLTGWGQTGPRARLAGHDINYIAVTGALAAIGEKGRQPVPPLNLIADFGGGGMLAVAGILSALIARQGSGLGQIVDVAMIDGVSALLASAHGYDSAGTTTHERGSNLLDGGSPFYRTYECADGEYVAVGAMEPKFFEALISELAVDLDPADQANRDRWPVIEAELASAFRTRSRAYWTDRFAQVDACVTPVLSLSEAALDPQLAERSVLMQRGGVREPTAAPRFSRTPTTSGRPPVPAGFDTDTILGEWGIPGDVVERLLADGTVRRASPPTDHL